MWITSFKKKYLKKIFFNLDYFYFFLYLVSENQLSAFYSSFYFNFYHLVFPQKF